MFYFESSSIIHHLGKFSLPDLLELMTCEQFLDGNTCNQGRSFCKAVLVLQELVSVNLSLGSMILACFDSVKDLHVLLSNSWSFLRPIKGMILCERNL